MKGEEWLKFGLPLCPVGTTGGIGFLVRRAATARSGFGVRTDTRIDRADGRGEFRALPKRRKRNRVRLRCRAAGQAEAPIADVAPGAELEADIVMDPDLGKAQPFVKADAA